MNAPVRPALRRSAFIAAAAQSVLAVLLGFAAIDSGGGERPMFWALAACAALGALAAAMLGTADRRTAKASDRINRAVVLVGVAFCVGAVGAVLGGNLLVLTLPVILLLVDAMLVGAARRVQTEPLSG